MAGAVAALLLAGCSAGQVGGATADGTTTSPTGEVPSDATGDATGAAAGDEETSMTQDPTAPAADAALTELDSGAAVSLTVGQERPLQLGSAWSWGEPVVDGGAVALTPVDHLLDPGYVEWLLTGAEAGSASLEVVGEPVCGDTTVCPPTTVTLSVEVTG